jgi:penicillin-binding protein 1A
MLGDRNENSQFSLATQGRRQPGSSFKVFALIAALEQGIDPNTKYVSEEKTYKVDVGLDKPEPWKVHNYDGIVRGKISLEEALWYSDNTVFADLAMNAGGRGLKDGPEKIAEVAERCGITVDLPKHPKPSIVLGAYEVSPLDMAAAYATIANGGYRNRPRAIRKIVRDGKTLKLPRRWRVHRVKAFPDGVTYEAVKILKQNMASGTGTHAQIGCPAGGKTGTTDKNIDAWFVGFTPRLSTAVWVGFPGNAQRSMNGMYLGGRNIDGGTYPADIWGTYMKKAVGSYCGDFKRPKNPFNGQPFLGRYAREGGKGDQGVDGNGGQVPAPGTETVPGNGGGGNVPDTNRGGTGNEDAAFNPDQYETPPQGAPETIDAGGGTQAPADG